MPTRILDWIALGLLIIGGLNTGFIGLFNFDVIIDLFSFNLMIAHGIFLLIGFAAIYSLVRALSVISRFHFNAE